VYQEVGIAYYCYDCCYSQVQRLFFAELLLDVVQLMVAMAQMVVS